MTERKRIAIIGLGMALKPHLESLRELGQRVEIAACYTPSAARRAAAAVQGLVVASDLDQMLADPGIAAVMILTPPATHLDLVRRAAAAGKAVLLEKPIELTTERAVAVVETMEAAGLPLGLVLQHRFRATSRHLAAIVERGELGLLVSASAAIRWWRPPEYYAVPGRGMKARDGGGVLLTQGIHTLDLFQSLAGPIRRVAAIAATSSLRAIDTEDVVGAAIELANGAVGTIDATTTAYPGFAERIELVGEKGTAVLGAETLEVFFKDGRVIREGGGPSNSGGADPMAFSNVAHKALITDFLDALDQGRPPRISGREALKVHRLIAAILRSSEERRPVEVD